MSSEATPHFPIAWIDIKDAGRKGDVQLLALSEGPELRDSEVSGVQTLSPSSDIARNGTCGDDESLLDQVRNKNKEALAVLFRRYARMVRAVAYRILRNQSEADDLLQEVFLQLLCRTLRRQFAADSDSKRWSADSTQISGSLQSSNAGQEAFESISISKERIQVLIEKESHAGFMPLSLGQVPEASSGDLEADSCEREWRQTPNQGR